MATPQHKNLYMYPRGHDFYYFSKSFLGYHYYIISSRTMHRSREEVFSRNTSILNFLPPKLPPLGSGGHKIYNFLSPYLTDATFQIWLRLAR